jgi:hypothetical protein
MKYQFLYAFDDRMLTMLGTEPIGQTILVIRLVMYAIQLAAKNTVIFVTDDPEAKNLFDQTVRGNGEFGNDDDSYLIEPTEEINKKENKQAWIDWSKTLNMQYSFIIENPPFAFGNTINAELIKHLSDDGRAVIIQPLNQYKGQKLYEHIEQFELADPKLFSDAVITENLNISIVTNKKQNKFTWQELVLESCDQNFRKFYDWNIANSRGIKMERKDYSNPQNFDVYKDFWETCKCFSSLGGGGFGSNGGGYQWNVLYNNSHMNAGVGMIRFNTKKEKDNFCKYWYKGGKGKELASRMALGIHMGGSVGPDTLLAIPQIDWETIDQNPLWNIDVDAAVLDTMGLKWNVDKTKIIDK